ncbi:4-hydroxy-3-methylbut-2-enyl diphosphate reductase [Faecalimonas hominis]
MEIKVAKTAGFCFGVKRAVETVYDQVEKEKGKQIYTYGPIIHNDEVVKDMQKRGVKVIQTEEELENLENGVVIIRSHGVPKRIYDKLAEKNIACVDATCPFVKKIHNIVKRESEAGSQIVIIGNNEHPEVEGIKGWSTSPVTVIQTMEDVNNFEPDRSGKVCIVSQTTFNYKKFEELVEIISKKRYDISVLNTICNATTERQTEARSIAEGVDAMIVIGDKHSSNTQKLFEICDKACNNTYYIQTLDDLDLNQLGSAKTVGITAGASTPNNIIEEVQNNVRINF